ncbi:MAG: recombination regulator RecX, partial [Chlorobiaceae bacterium]|nr:recombination regulator RecX [Chlorobiaceae bacterium]
FAYAMRVLALRSHSREELLRKLLKKNFSIPIANATIERVEALKLIDDEAFARELISSRSRKRPQGKIKMRAELSGKGVSETVIADLLRDYDSTMLCYQAGRKKLANLRGADSAAVRSKLERFLYNRGFEWNSIEQTIKKLLDQSTSSGDEMD